MMWNRVLLSWFVLPVVAQTENSRDVLCVYPLSGVYAPLQRILFYLLLSFGVIGRRQRWLVAGALASAMTYCGAAAIHSVLLLANARSPVVDLDVYGVFAATSTGIMLTTPLLAWSTTLQAVEREVRMLITLWTLLILVGAILAIATIYIRGETKGAPCYDSLSTVDIPSTVSTLRNVTASCTYVCFPEESPLGRSPDDVLAWENTLSRPFDIISVFLPTIAASVPAAFIAWTQYVFRSGYSYLIRPPPFFSRLELGWLGELLFEKRRDSNLNHNSSSARIPSEPSPGQSPVRFPWLAVAYQYYFVLGSFGVFVVNLVMNEVRFRELPVNEMMYEVDQWTSWVGVALILLAQVLSRFFKRSKRHTSQTVGDCEELPWDQERGEDAYRKMGIRTDTFRSEVSTFRRRNSL
ncbi:hypothetical protein ASPVEDRAFT_37451 [Aspergillus versicolor CBS 583.65]|uniref:Uncharacterized protein n=1 Tax=Aspergillus versicolor CBS 583.65 TaxID=1036611 RepID=A0A1L9P8Z3_ASPVE|nr:uncharacterized protein ASPVEDRAFT_37451 [Aspergillus versicolor CBS 583.65]OJI97999.1 hypothetical protein ASPVEDRAFT_37451 [Aspergillus versicolor CBS 583.65]